MRLVCFWRGRLSLFSPLLECRVGMPVKAPGGHLAFVFGLSFLLLQTRSGLLGGPATSGF